MVTVGVELDFVDLELDTLLESVSSPERLASFRVNDLSMTEVSSEFAIPGAVLSDAGLLAAAPDTTYFSMDIELDSVASDFVITIGGTGTIIPPFSGSDFSATVDPNGVASLAYQGVKKELEIVLPADTPLDLGVEGFAEINTVGSSSTELGACCDRSSNICTPDITLAECVPNEWLGGGLCSDFAPPCKLPAVSEWVLAASALFFLLGAGAILRTSNS